MSRAPPKRGSNLCPFCWLAYLQLIYEPGPSTARRHMCKRLTRRGRQTNTVERKKPSQLLGGGGTRASMNSAYFLSCRKAAVVAGSPFKAATAASRIWFLPFSFDDRERPLLRALSLRDTILENTAPDTISIRASFSLINPIPRARDAANCFLRSIEKKSLSLSLSFSSLRTVTFRLPWSRNVTDRQIYIISGFFSFFLPFRERLEISSNSSP